MTEEEFFTKINELKLLRKIKLQELNNNVQKRIDALPIQEKLKNNIKSEQKLKAVEFRAKEDKNLKEIVLTYQNIIKKINENVDISDEERQIQINNARESFIEAYENNQNEMIVLREEYSNFNLISYENFYNNLSSNSSSFAVSHEFDEKEGASFLGANNKFFDPSGEGGSQI